MLLISDAQSKKFISRIASCGQVNITGYELDWNAADVVGVSGRLQTCDDCVGYLSGVPHAIADELLISIALTFNESYRYLLPTVTAHTRNFGLNHSAVKSRYPIPHWKN